MMPTTSNFREKLSAALSLAIGSAVAFSLVGLSLTSGPKPHSKAIRLSQGVRFTAPVLTAPASLPAVALPIQTPDAPTQKPKITKQLQAQVAPQPKQPTQPPTTSDSPIIELSTAPALAQPAYQGTVALPPTTDLPMLPGQASYSEDARPSAPADDYAPPPQEFLETPGGEVLVMGVLVGHTGRVVAVRVLVPSWDDLKNYTLAIVAKDLTLSEVDPPLAVGETRWLEVRYLIPKSKPGLLP